ncbi:Uu.00g052080.m01.CDS01 [Anthostomella pinea]|uniref:Uu.00g052080.m01.CDS01 n=1 Tax=Anthostomella pinea TaxID=933095 RepID=A0AAI8VXD9_9PEZI|nr:Uu.00g052080.m01.CDS01 [Anthostomella pinea]
MKLSGSLALMAAFVAVGNSKPLPPLDTADNCIVCIKRCTQRDTLNCIETCRDEICKDVDLSEFNIFKIPIPIIPIDAAASS